MEKHAVHIALHVVIVLVSISMCNAVPLRSRRQAQDLVHLHDSVPLQDYDDGDFHVDDLQDDTSQLSPLDESESDNSHHDPDDHGLHGNSSEGLDDPGLAHEPETDGLIHDVDIIHRDRSENGNGQSNQLVDHAINGVRDLHENTRSSYTDSEVSGNEQLHFQGQGHLSSARQSAVHPTSVSQGHIELPAITRRANNSNGQRLVLNSYDTVDGAVNHINVSTHEENERHHGFLTTTTTPNRFATVKILNISSQEQTESSAQEHRPNTGVIIQQNSGAHSDHESESVDSTGHLNGNDINTSTEMPQSHDGHLALLPGEPHVHDPEHGEHLSGHEEPDGHHPGIDVPIDKGEYPHNNEGEHGDRGHQRHTNNPVVQTPSHNANSPEVEPTPTTPKLMILPTPSDPEERNNSAAYLEPNSSVSHPGVENGHTESYHESAGHTGESGESHVQGNSGHGNDSEERLNTAGEGHIEFITEVPEIHGENEIKPNKHMTKEPGEKISTLQSSISPSSHLFVSESLTNLLSTSEITFLESKPRFTQTEEYTLSNSVISLASSHSVVESSHMNVRRTVFPHSLQHGSLNTNTDHTDVASSETVYSRLPEHSRVLINSVPQSSVSKGLIASSLPVQQVVGHSTSLESLTPSLPDVSSVPLFEANTTIQQLSISSSSRNYFTTLGNEPSSKEFTEGSSVWTVQPMQPSQSNEQSKETDLTTSSSSLMNVKSSVTPMTLSYPSSTPSLSGGLYSTTSYSLAVAPTPTTPYFESTQGTEEYTSQTYTPATVATQSIQAPVSISVLTSNPTTKKKEGHNSTTLASTTFTTRKKPDSGKEPEKPENQSSTTSSSEGTTTTTTTTTQNTTSGTFTSTILSIVSVTSSQKPVLTTPPSVYIEIQLRMDWNQFCVTRSQFISEIKDIVLTKKGYIVDEEQFKMNTEDCSGANSLLDGGQINSITIEMYVVDTDGKLDILLTTVTSSVISKGFQQSNYLKDKIVSVHTMGTLHSEILPDSKTDRKQAPPAVTMVIVIASVGGVCCVALIILQVLIHRRIKAKRKQRTFIGQRASLQSMDHVALGVIPKSRPSSGYWNPALDDTIELPEPEENSHIMNFSALANFCMDTKGIHGEFQTIPFDDVEVTSVPVGDEDKNRFANVLPHKDSRVCLKVTQENKSGYINANHVNGYMGEKKVYIATQSPLVNTVEDFWRMVWEQQSRTILMLNPVTQQGKSKQSTCYWPDNLETDCRREFGDYIVTLKKRDVQHDYVDCTLEIMDIERNLKREVHHFWFTCWSDTGPPEPLALVKFVLDTRPHFENSGSPVIVHCGPGTGRTGVYITVDMCMRMFEDRRRVDILNCVYKMRSERAGAVQTKEQYNIIYQALNEYAVILSSPSISTRSSVITLHAML